jgi:acyl-CoA thioester hydrolase
VSAIEWDLPDPFTIEIEVQAADIDSYGHTNNAVYLTWLDRIAWQHCLAVGATEQDHVRLRRGMAAWKTESHYIAATFEGEKLLGSNWLVHNDGKFRAWRRYQIVRPSDGLTVFRALTMFVCIDLDRGRPTRFPDIYRERYAVLPSVAEALEAEGDSPFKIDG